MLTLCKIINKLEGAGALLMLPAVPGQFVLSGGAYCSCHARLLSALLSQMAKEFVCSIHSVLIMMMSYFSWKIGTGEKKKDCDFQGPKIGISHLKFSKRSQSLTVTSVLHTSDSEGWNVQAHYAAIPLIKHLTRTLCLSPDTLFDGSSVDMKTLQPLRYFSSNKHT